MTNYRRCLRCVMDTSDPNINFDENGFCNHCNDYYKITKNEWYINEIGQNKINALIQVLKRNKGNNKYDCIIGLSGGIDSSYLALKLYEWGINPLVVHVDAGWNTQQAVNNIEKIINYCNFDLYTHVVDWEEIQSLHISYLKSGISNQDVPQDHVFFATLYKYAAKNNIKYVLTGSNIATESIFPNSWHVSALDSINLLSIHSKFNSSKLKTYTTISFFNYYIWYPYIKGMKIIKPLNYLNYNKEIAIEELITKVGWQKYGRKHGESFFTKLFQNHILPIRYGYDKRITHYSSLIVSGQLTREEALKFLTEPLYNDEDLERDIHYFCKKLNISINEFTNYITMPKKYYTEYSNWDKYYKPLKKLQNLIKNIYKKY